MAHDPEDFTPAINRMISDIEKRDAETAEMKRMVNKLCTYAGLPPRYPETGPGGGGGGTSLKSDQFYGKPLATAAREFLEMRGSPSSGGLGAATVREIFVALKEGGFAFDTKNDVNAMRGLRISLAKNTQTFHRLPSGTFGVRSWYPNAKVPKPPSDAEALQEVVIDEIDEAFGGASQETKAANAKKTSAA